MRYVAPTLLVRSVEESLRFYTAALGFEEWFRYDVAGRLETAGVMRGGVRVILDRTAETDQARMAHYGAGVTLYVDMGETDIDDYYIHVQPRAKVLRPIADKPWGDRVFTVADPDGYALSFALTRTPA
jgi:uncharacterized glyoxalase superfamily protein PhnB